MQRAHPDTGDVGRGWTIGGAIRTWARSTPSSVAIRCEGESWTWSELFERSCRVANGLVAAGLGPGDRVLYAGSNRAEYFELAIGASLVGVVSMAANSRLAPGELVDVVRASGARVVLTEPGVGDPLVAEMTDDSGVERLLLLGAPDQQDDYESWLAGQDLVDPARHVKPDDFAIAMYTSGTTGRPKAAVFTHAALEAGLNLADVMEIDQFSVVLASMPVFHAGGRTLGLITLSQGAILVIGRDTSPDGILADLTRHRATVTIAVPDVLRRVLETPDFASFDTSWIQTVGYAGSPISRALLDRLVADLDCRLVQIYGMTETSHATVLRPEEHEDPVRRASVGRALPGVSVRIVDGETGEDAADGAYGEVWIGSRSTMAGYLDDDEATATVLTRDGFMRSGDGGRLQDGYLLLADRLKDTIITGGENVNPGDVEAVLAEVAGVSQVAVIGLPSTRWGEAVTAAVVRDAGSEVTAEELVNHARSRLAGFKVPKEIRFLDELPRNPTGKIIRAALKHQLGASREKGHR